MTRADITPRAMPFGHGWLGRWAVPILQEGQCPSSFPEGRMGNAHPTRPGPADLEKCGRRRSWRKDADA